MSAIIKKLKTSENGVEKVVLPITVLEAVVDPETNQSLNNIVQDLNNKIENTPSGGGTTYEEATESEAGLMSPQDKVKLNSVEAGANNYTHPGSGVTAGTYKSVIVNEKGHVTSGTNPTTLEGYGITDAEAKGTASSAVSAHDTSTSAHNDIRDLINGLTTRLNTLADSDDTTLDQMSEIVAYIKSNKTLIESITTNKVNVLDIIDNLTTNVSDKPLSAAQGVAIKSLIDALQTAVNGKANASDLTSHIDNKSNPHSITKSQVGLGNVNNTSDANKPVSTAQQTAINNALTAAKTYADTAINNIGFKGYSCEVNPGSQIILSKPNGAYAIYVQLRALVVFQIGTVSNLYSVYNNSGSSFQISPVIVNQGASHGSLFINSSGYLCINNTNTSSALRCFVLYI